MHIMLQVIALNKILKYNKQKMLYFIYGMASFLDRSFIEFIFANVVYLQKLCKQHTIQKFITLKLFLL